MNFEEEAWKDIAELNLKGKDFEDLKLEKDEMINPVIEEGNMNIKNYLDLKQRIKGHPDPIEWFQNVLECGARYTATVAEHEYQRREMNKPDAEFSSRGELGRSDETRRTAHLALVDAIRIFCRAANKDGIDFGFLYDILQGDDETVRINVRKFITDVLDYEVVQNIRKGGE